MLIEYKCEKCGKVHQILIPKESIPVKCDICGGELKKIFPKGFFRI